MNQLKLFTSEYYISEIKRKLMKSDDRLRAINKPLTIKSMRQKFNAKVMTDEQINELKIKSYTEEL